jgi:uncharacterized protein YkwD
MRSRKSGVRARLLFEHLEDRTVPTTATLTGGVLNVLGSSGADNIQVSQSNGVINVSGVTNTFNASQVKLISIEAGAADDVVTIDQSVTATAWVFGNSGNDRITAGGGSATIYGGSGNDTITGGLGADVLYGGLGTNMVTGQTGDQVSQGTLNVSMSATAIAQDVVRLTNEFRAANGLAPLQLSGQLAALADLQAKNMVSMVPVVGFNAAMSHTLYGAPEVTLTSRADYVGYDWTSIGENIAYGYGSADAVVQAWINSPGHRANLLNASFTQIGVSVAYTREGIPYFSQDFGTPTASNPAAPASVTNGGMTTTQPNGNVPPPSSNIPPSSSVTVTAGGNTTSATGGSTLTTGGNSRLASGNLPPSNGSTLPKSSSPPPSVTTPPATVSPPVSNPVVVTQGFGAGPTRAGQIYAVGTGSGAIGTVTVYDMATGNQRFQIQAYGSAFRGGVRVAVADMTGDGKQDVVVAPGPGISPLVKVYDGTTGNLLKNFYAYSAYWMGGVNVAVGDVNGDGRADIVTGADAGGVPYVRVFDGRTLGAIRGFYAYTSAFRGGVRVAVGDTNGDGKADIITSPGAGMSSIVKAFSGANGGLLSSFYAYDVGWLGGAFVAAGDVNGDGHADIVTGADAGAMSHVKAFSGTNLSLLASFNNDPGFTGGVRVAVRDVTGDGKAEIITAEGPAGNAVRMRNGSGTSVLAGFLAGDPSSRSGLYVG